MLSTFSHSLPSYGYSNSDMEFMFELWWQIIITPEHQLLAAVKESWGCLSGHAISVLRSRSKGLEQIISLPPVYQHRINAEC